MFPGADSFLISPFINQFCQGSLHQLKRHRRVIIGDWIFPVSTFTNNQYHLLSSIHVPIDHTKDYWSCKWESAIHLEDWTVKAFVDESSLLKSPKSTLLMSDAMPLKCYLEILLLARTQEFGRIKFCGSEKRITSSILRYEVLEPVSPLSLMKRNQMESRRKLSMWTACSLLIRKDVIGLGNHGQYRSSKDPY